MNDERLPITIVLAKGQIAADLMRRRKRLEVRVGNYTHDRDLRSIRPAATDAQPEWALSGPQTRRHRTADHHDERGVHRIGARERATRLEAKAKRIYKLLIGDGRTDADGSVARACREAVD